MQHLSTNWARDPGTAISFGACLRLEACTKPSATLIGEQIDGDHSNRGPPQNTMLHDLGNIEIVTQKSIIKTQNSYRDIETKTQAAPLNKITKKPAADVTSQHETKNNPKLVYVISLRKKKRHIRNTDKSQQYLHYSKTHRHETHKMTNVRHRLHKRMQLHRYHSKHNPFKIEQANKNLEYQNQYLINALEQFIALRARSPRKWLQIRKSLLGETIWSNIS